jgi:hypothetical protein
MPVSSPFLNISTRICARNARNAHHAIAQSLLGQHCIVANKVLEPHTLPVATSMNRFISRQMREGIIDATNTRQSQKSPDDPHNDPQRGTRENFRAGKSKSAILTAFQLTVLRRKKYRN